MENTRGVTFGSRVMRVITTSVIGVCKGMLLFALADLLFYLFALEPAKRMNFFYFLGFEHLQYLFYYTIPLQLTLTEGFRGYAARQSEMDFEESDYLTLGHLSWTTAIGTGRGGEGRRKKLVGDRACK
jgi:hypothetical protein